MSRFHFIAASEPLEEIVDSNIIPLKLKEGCSCVIDDNGKIVVRGTKEGEEPYRPCSPGERPDMIKMKEGERHCDLTVFRSQHHEWAYQGDDCKFFYEFSFTLSEDYLKIFKAYLDRMFDREKIIELWNYVDPVFEDADLEEYEMNLSRLTVGNMKRMLYKPDYSYCAIIH